MTHQPETARELASLAVNAGRALQDEKRHYEIACQENARLRAALERIHQMTDYWEQNLPEVIRTPAVVSALRAAMERAEPAAVSAAVAPPTNHGLSVQHADALYDAIATPGPARESFDDQHARVCAVVRQILDELLHAPADKAAVYREAADDLATAFGDPMAKHIGALGASHLRRRAREIEAGQRRMADETATEHRPAVSRWRVETLDNLANEWAPGTGWPVRALAVERFDAMNAKAPRWKDGTPVTRRLVRETTTYTVEAEHQPAAGARQDGAQQ